MVDLDAIELNFPCEYPLRAIGQQDESFDAAVIDVVCRYVPGLTNESFRCRTSSGNKYRSISVTFIAESRQQVNAIYEELGRLPLLVTAL